MSYNLILNSTNVSPFQKNTYTYNFSDGAFQIKDSSVLCISDITIPYSWFNISTNLNNNVFSITDWLGVNHDIVLSDGFYTVNDVNLFLQNYFLNNGMYLIDNNGSAVVYVYMATNQSAYANQIITYAVPTSLPVGWSLPTISTWIGFPATPTAPSVNILNNAFQQYLGFTTGSYGGGTQDSSVLSNIVPNATTVNSIVVTCNIVKNDAGSGGTGNILDSFPITSQFGANINYQPPFEKNIKLNGGRFNSISISFLDQSLNTLPMTDTNVTISLLLKI